MVLGIDQLFLLSSKLDLAFNGILLRYPCYNSLLSSHKIESHGSYQNIILSVVSKHI